MMRKFFLRRLRIFFIYMLIPTLFIFIATFILFVQNSEKDLHKKGMQTSLAVETNFDLVISNVLYQNDLLTNTTRMSLALKKILDSKKTTYADAIYISSLSSILNSIIYSHSYIDSIFLYLDNCDSFFSSGVGVQNINSVLDSSWLKIYKQMKGDLDINVVRREDDSGTTLNKIDTLTVFQRLLLQKGCIAVNINIKKFQKILGTMFSNENETIYLLNSAGDILVKETSNANEKELSQDYFNGLINENGGDIEKALDKVNSRWISENKAKYLLSIRKYDYMDVYIVSSISADAKTGLLITVFRTFLLILVANFFVVMVLAYITTKRTFDQISYMIQAFNDAEKGIFIKQPKSRLRDEYDVIMNNIIYFFLNTSYLNTQLKEKQYREKVIELTALQLQINPHFLFNTLQTLDLEVRKNTGEIENISTIIRNVSDILKYALSDSQTEVPLQVEIQYLKKYATIQTYRFGGKFIIYYEVDDEIINARVFRLMLQPLLENSLIHGIRNLQRKAYIKVKIFKQKGSLFCAVIDNGIGMKKERITELYNQINNENSSSIGLTNLNRRLILKYGEESALHIQAKINWGTSISFRIPFNEKNEE